MTPELLFLIALLCLFIVMLLVRLSNLNKIAGSVKREASNSSVPAPVPVSSTCENPDDDGELVAVITAAVVANRKARQAMHLPGHTLPPHGFIIRRIRQIS